MAKPEPVTRFFYYLSLLRQGLPLSHSLVADGVDVGDRELSPIRKRQFLDDIAYLRELLPLWQPGTELQTVGEGRYQLVRTSGRTKLEEVEFLPFLQSLVRTTNLFPFTAQGWLGHLETTYGHPLLKAVEGRVLYTSTPHPDKLRSEPFHVLVQALVTRKRVQMQYLNPRGDVRRLTFEPMAFLNHNGVWYLIGDGAFEHRPEPSDQPTQLKLSRVRRCEPGQDPFQDRFDLKKTLDRLRATYGSHLILTDKTGPRRVTLRFSGDAVAHVSESYFHQDQETRRNDDGTLDLSLKVNDLFDALQLLGQWGDLARPVEPPELIQAWKERARQVAVWAEKN